MVKNDENYKEVVDAMDKVKKENKEFADISEEQKNAVLTFFFSEFQYVFVTGGGGTGKSTVLRFFLKVCKKLGDSVLKASTTGISALQIDGQTLHQSLGVSTDMVKYEIERKEATPLFRKAEYIIVDEVSMMKEDIFRVLEKRLKSEQKVILAGDEFQIGAVQENNDDSMYGTFSTKLFAFLKKQMDVVVLREVHRQTASKDHEILEKIRKGNYVLEMKDWFGKEYDLTGKDDENMNKIAEELIEAQKKGRKIHFLSFKNVTCEKINAACQKILTRDPEAYRTYEPTEIPMKDLDDIVFPTSSAKNQLKARIDLDKKIAKRDHKKVTLCVGQMVMISINEKVPSFEECRKYANGSIGVVKALGEDTVTVCLNSGEEVKVTWENDDRNVLYPEDKKTLWCYQRIRYMPLIGANALTIHKSQGQTMDKIFLDPRGCKQAGLIYTALSRVKRLEDVVLVAPIEKENVVVDRHVKAYYDFIDREGRSYDEQELVYLEERMQAIDSYIDSYKEAEIILRGGIPELIKMIEKKRYDAHGCEGDLAVWEIDRMLLFNKLYDLPDDFKDPRLPYAVEAAIDDRNGPILEAWVNGVFDDVLDIEAYGMSLLEQPKVQLTKEEAVFELFASDMQAGVYDDERWDEYLDEHLDEYMDNLDENLDKYTYEYLEANKLAFPEFDEKDL